MKQGNAKVGQRRAYVSKANNGMGKVTKVYADSRGSPWVTLHDKDRGVDVTVRPSQLGAAR